MADVAALPQEIDAQAPAPSVDELWERINGRIDLRLRVIERGALVLLDRALGPDEIADSITEANLLAQWLGVLHLGGAAALCRELVQLVGVERPDAATGLQMAALVDDLRAVVYAASAEVTSPDEAAPLVRIVSRIDAHVDSLMWLLTRRGLRVEHDSQGLGDLTGVDALVVLSGATPTVAQTLLALGRERSPGIQRVVLHENAPVDTLCRLARFSDLVLPIASKPDFLTDEIQHLVLASRIADDTVTVLGDASLVSVLERFGVEARAVRTLNAALATLVRGSRTLVLGHAHETVDADALIRLVRASPVLREVTVVAVGFDGNEGLRLRQDGADVVAPSGHDPDEWVLQLKSFRHRRLRGVDEGSDDGGVVLPWARASVLLERALVVSRRVDTHVGVAVLHFDEDLPESELDRVLALLATEFRQDDVVGRWDERRVVVMLRGAGRRAATARFRSALRDLEIETSARIGIAEFPVDGTTLQEVLGEAARAIETATREGGPRVVATDWRPVSDRAADVVLVEADNTLAGVLDGLFDRSGLTTMHIDNGADALRYLTDASAPVPRLVILEMDAQGADGLMVLRALRRGGWMNRLRVLVTCSQIRDGELREAFELGALDVVVKPYAAIVMQQRVNRLLEA
ncbi:MAG: response regulator [Acidimicrobiales bacterium]